MADEQVVPEVPVAGAEPASTPEVTATPEVAAGTPEVQPEGAPKTFTQEELDIAIGKRLAREHRKWEREQAERRAVAPAQQAPVAGEVPAGEAPDVLELAEQLLNQREQAKHTAKIVEAYGEREEAAREKYDDFEQVAYNPKLPITEPMAVTIRESDVGPEILYHLGNNPAEAKRIAQLSPLSQAKEIGKLEDKLATNPPAKKTSSAPPPIAPATGRSPATPAFDTTNPRSIAAMDTTTWINKERERTRKRLESQPR